MPISRRLVALLLVTSTSLFSTSTALPSHLSLERRQGQNPPTSPNPPTSTTSSAPASTSSTTSSHSPVSTTLIVPVAVVLGSIFILILLYAFRRSLFPWAKKDLSLPNAAPSVVQPRSSTSTQNLTAEQLTSRSTLPRPAGETRTSPVASSANGRRRSGRRNVRRTESGHSVKTLPEYSENAGDQELVLVRQRPESIISESDEEFSVSGDIADTSSQALLPSDVITELEPIHTSDGPVSRADMRRSVGSQRSSRTVRAGVAAEEVVQEVQRPTSPSGPREPHSAPVGTTISRAIGSLTRRGWGEAPTYLEAMSSPDFRDVEAEAGVPPPRNGATAPLARSGSGFRNFLSRTGLAPSSFRTPNPNPQLQMQERAGSSTSLLLQPTSSRLTVQSSSTSPYSSPWASTHSLIISSPVPNSAVRASFEMPRAGLSDDQMRFLGSSEAVNVAGVKLGDPPPGRRRRRSEVPPMEGSPSPSPGGDGQGQGQGDAPPPTWEQVDDERRRNEADGRRGLARPTGEVEERAGRPSVAAREEGVAAPQETQTAVKESRRPTLSIPILVGPAVSPSVEIAIEPPTPIQPNSNALSIK